MIAMFTVSTRPGATRLLRKYKPHRASSRTATMYPMRQASLAIEICGESRRPEMRQVTHITDQRTDGGGYGVQTIPSVATVCRVEPEEGGGFIDPGRTIVLETRSP